MCAGSMATQRNRIEDYFYCLWHHSGIATVRLQSITLSGYLGWYSSVGVRPTTRVRHGIACDKLKIEFGIRKIFVSDGIKLEPFCIQCTETIILTGNVSRSSKPIFNKEFRLKFNTKYDFSCRFWRIACFGWISNGIPHHCYFVFYYPRHNIRPSMCLTRSSIWNSGKGSNTSKPT